MDKQTNGQTDNRTDRQTDTPFGNVLPHTALPRHYGQTDQLTNGQTDKWTNRHMDKQTYGQTDNHTDRQTNKQTHKTVQGFPTRNIKTETLMCYYFVLKNSKIYKKLIFGENIDPGGLCWVFTSKPKFL